ncbi:hypothetical protein LXL04_006973 [Taraxacum kok-saghyz]
MFSDNFGVLAGTHKMHQDKSPAMPTSSLTLNTTMDGQMLLLPSLLSPHHCSLFSIVSSPALPIIYPLQIGKSYFGSKSQIEIQPNQRKSRQIQDPRFCSTENDIEIVGDRGVVEEFEGRYGDGWKQRTSWGDGGHARGD